MGACRNANKKKIDCMCQLLISAMTSIILKLFQDTTGDYIF